MLTWRSSQQCYPESTTFLPPSTFCVRFQGPSTGQPTSSMYVQQRTALATFTRHFHKQSGFITWASNAGIVARQGSRQPTWAVGLCIWRWVCLSFSKGRCHIGHMYAQLHLVLEYLQNNVLKLMTCPSNLLPRLLSHSRVCLCTLPNTRMASD